MRVPVHTLAGLLHADFRLPSAVDYTTFLRATRFLTRSQVEVNQAYARAVFNVVFNNRDDHPKNLSYRLGRDRTWRLAPAYDLTYSPGAHSRWRAPLPSARRAIPSGAGPSRSSALRSRVIGGCWVDGIGLSTSWGLRTMSSIAARCRCRSRGGWRIPCPATCWRRIARWQPDPQTLTRPRRTLAKCRPPICGASPGSDNQSFRRGSRPHR
jgi:hypothetical protein